MKKMYGLYKRSCGLQFTGIVSDSKKEIEKYVYKKYCTTKDRKEYLERMYNKNKNNKKYRDKFDYYFKTSFTYTLEIKEIKKVEYK